MTTVFHRTKNISSYVEAPTISLRFRLLREGEVTNTTKYLRFYRDWGTVGQLCLAFASEEGDGGEYTSTITKLNLAMMVAQGEWLVTGQDNAVPRKTKAAYLTFTASGTFTYDISSGDGSGGVPATVDAKVDVDEVAANRELVVLERPSNGEWRVAGYASTVEGLVEVQLKVTEGQYYAFAMDDYGLMFQANLPVVVGQRIHPSLFLGWVYEVTQAGTLPTTEPEWWEMEGDNVPRLIGTCRLQAARYYRPLAHGPFPVDIT